MCKIVRENKALLVLILFFFLLYPLFGRGKQEEKEPEIQNPEFTLCITEFDVSALPAGQRVLGPILQRELIWDLSRIHHRVRGDDELLRYEEMARIAAIHAAADKLARERERRDELLYQGHPNWKYRKELKARNKEIKKLEEEYAKARDENPVIEELPLFKFIAANSGTPATFPRPPEKGKEEAFIRSNRVDAFLEGKFRLFYGRIYAEFRIVARGTSFSYEDSAIFSPESINSAADELKRRFLSALINSEMIRMVLNTDPEDAQIEVNGRIVKSGVPLELPPGPVTIAVSADDYQTETKEVELEGGESEFDFTLKPVPMETLGVKFPGPNSSVYMGAKHMGGNPVVKEEEPEEELQEAAMIEQEGEQDDQDTTALEETEEQKPVEETAIAEDESENGEEGEETAIAEGEEGEEIAEGEETPEDEEDPDLAGKQAGFFSVHVPIGQYRYIRVDTEDGLTGEAIVKGGGTPGETRIITLQPRKLPGKDDKPVERARKKFYGAYGRFWITLPVAFFVNGVYQGFLISYQNTGNPDMFNNATTSYYISIGAWSLTGVFLAETLVRMFVYVHTGTKESIPFKE